MTTKMKSGLFLNEPSSPKVEMRKIIISRGTHRQVNKQQFFKKYNEQENQLKFNDNKSKTSFFQDELLISSQQKSDLIDRNKKQFKLNSSRLKKRQQPKLSSSLSKFNDFQISSRQFYNNPEQQKSLKSKRSSLSLRRQSSVPIQRQQTNVSIKNSKEQTNEKQQISCQSVQKQLNQLQIKLQELIKSKLQHMQKQLKLKKFLGKSTKISEKQGQSLLNLVHTEQFQTIENQIKQIQKQLSLINLDLIKEQDSYNKDRIIKLGQKKAQKIVQGELYKKYYLGSRSIEKSTKYQLEDKTLNIRCSQQLILNRNKISSQNKNLKKVEEIQSLSKISYQNPKAQDYQTYRYKQPAYKPNLQPLPRSVYKAQYLESSVKQAQKKASFIQNIIFGKSQRSKSSNYRDSFNRVLQKSELVNHKQLDAYKDKFRDIKLSYIPKKRIQTQQTIRKAKKNNTANYLKQLKSTKLFALQSQRSTYQMKGPQSFKESYLSQIKRQFQGSPGVKSQIKHKQLNNFRYQFKKMFHS